MKKTTGINHISIILFLACLIVFLPHISISQCHLLDIRDAVMAEGMIITAQTSYGIIDIQAGKGCIREFKWDAGLFKTELIPRKERWNGHFGLYHPQLRPPHKNVVHMVVEEYQDDFKSMKDVNKYLSTQKGGEVVYNDNGLHIIFLKRISSSGQIFIMVRVSQILINGVKPVMIKGSSNSKISVTKNT